MTIKEFLTSDNYDNAQPIPWNAPDFSRRSLELHLDQNHDVNSRREFIIKDHVEWIHRELLNETPSKILDLACGPGLYTTKLAAKGHTCVGVDLSPEIIDYAKENNLQNCDYYCQDILKFQSTENFDLILLNFGWLHNFSIKNINRLLSNISDMLSENGIFILELLHFESIQNYGEDIPQWHKTEAGIFSDSPYIFLQDNIWDGDTNHAHLYYHILNNAGEIVSYVQNYQAFQQDEIEELLKKHNFIEFETFDSISIEDDFDDELYFLTARK